MLDFLIVYSLIIGIRCLILSNRPIEKLDAGDIAFLNKHRGKKNLFLSIEEMMPKLKKKGIGLIVTAACLVVVYFIVMVAYMGMLMQGM